MRPHCTGLGKDGLRSTRAGLDALPNLIPHDPPPDHWAAPDKARSK
ncbi:hypothetical protein ACIQ6Y_37575 [Streptomyces sp. NPDC096205]